MPTGYITELKETLNRKMLDTTIDTDLLLVQISILLSL